MNGLSRRRVLLSAAAATTTSLAGCTGGDEPSDTGAGTPTATASDANAGGTVGAAGADDAENTATTTPASGPDPNCALLAGSPTPYDAAGTPLVFTFDYVDSWELQDPIQGPGGMIQGISSPVVRVDGETESAGLTVGQKFEALTAAEAEAAAPDAEAYPDRFNVTEQAFDGETVRFYSIAGAELPFYQAWLPHGDGEARYYELSLMLNTSILRVNEGTLCLENTVPGIETVRTSISANAETTIAEVNEQ